jgi:hypothetical protein
MIDRHCRLTCAHDARRANAHNNGGIKIGNIKCENCDNEPADGTPGIKITPAVTIVNNTGHGNPTRSPIATITTVANNNPNSQIITDTNHILSTRPPQKWGKQAKSPK